MPTPRRHISQQALAALAAGVALTAAAPQVPAVDAPAVPGPEASAAPAAPIVDGAPAVTAPAAEVPAAGAPEADSAPGVLAAPAADAGVLNLLQTQLAAANQGLIALNVEKAGLESRLAAADAQMPALLAIAAKSASNMSVALGGAALSVEGLSASQVVAEHTRLEASFLNKFKVGGVAAVDAEEQAAAPSAAADPLHQRRIAAARPSK